MFGFVPKQPLTTFTQIGVILPLACLRACELEFGFSVGANRKIGIDRCAVVIDTLSRAFEFSTV